MSEGQQGVRSNGTCWLRYSVDRTLKQLIHNTTSAVCKQPKQPIPKRTKHRQIPNTLLDLHSRYTARHASARKEVSSKQLTNKKNFSIWLNIISVFSYEITNKEMKQNKSHDESEREMEKQIKSQTITTEKCLRHRPYKTKQLLVAEANTMKIMDWRGPDLNVSII